MEVEDRPVTETLSVETHEDSAGRKVGRHYIRELFRLKGELVKLQDWVVRARHRLAGPRLAKGPADAVRSNWPRPRTTASVAAFPDY